MSFDMLRTLVFYSFQLDAETIKKYKVAIAFK